MAKVYSEDDKAALREQAQLSADSQTCPVCGARGIRRYYTMSYGRSTPVILSCTWCPNCHSYTGSTTPARGRVVDSDPVAQMPGAPADTGEQMEEYLAFLDGLWDAGKLPQQLIRDDGRSRA